MDKSGKYNFLANINCFLAMFPKGEQTRRHCFMAIFPKGGQTRKQCFLAMFPEGGQTKKLFLQQKSS